MDEVEAIFHELMAIPSPSDGDNAPILTAVARRAEAAGLRTELHSKEGILTATHGKGGVLLSGHLDTVPLGSGWTKGQGQQEGQRIYGRGTSDMKGGCAAALAAVLSLAREGIPCGVIFSTDEETGMHGARRLGNLDILREAAAIIVCEPTDGAVMLREKGVYWTRVITHGKGAHGAMTHLGESAIFRMVRLLQQLEPLEKPADPLGEPTLNVGTIQGGSRPNVVADHCEASVDIRWPPSMDLPGVEAFLRRHLDKAQVPYDLEVLQTLPAVGVPEDAEHVLVLRKLTGGATGTVPYATEMAVFHAANPRGAIYGPGHPKVIHQADEYVEWPQVAQAQRVYEAFARALAP